MVKIRIVRRAAIIILRLVHQLLQVKRSAYLVYLAGIRLQRGIMYLAAHLRVIIRAVLPKRRAVGRSAHPVPPVRGSVLLPETNRKIYLNRLRKLCILRNLADNSTHVKISASVIAAKIAVVGHLPGRIARSKTPRTRWGNIKTIVLPGGSLVRTAAVRAPSVNALQHRVTAAYHIIPIILVSYQIGYTNRGAQLQLLNGVSLGFIGRHSIKIRIARRVQCNNTVYLCALPQLVTAGIKLNGLQCAGAGGVRNLVKINPVPHLAYVVIRKYIGQYVCPVTVAVGFLRMLVVLHKPAGYHGPCYGARNLAVLLIRAINIIKAKLHIVKQGRYHLPARKLLVVNFPFLGSGLGVRIPIQPRKIITVF